MALLTQAACSALVIAALIGCSADVAVDRSESDRAGELQQSPGGPAESGAGSPSPSPSPSTPATAAQVPALPEATLPEAPSEPPRVVTPPARVPSAPTSPLALPAGPATRRPVSPVLPGTLMGLDWARRAVPANCPRPERGAPVPGDLDGDGVDEVALPLSCPWGGASSVLVYAGTAAAPRLVGDALLPEQGARVNGVQVRDGHLVVGGVGYSGPDRAGPPDIAVTTRWVLREDRIVRTDRWEDPVSVLDMDEGE